MTTKLGEFEEAFLESLRALGWTIEPPRDVVVDGYEPKVHDRVYVTLMPTEEYFGTVVEVEGPDAFLVRCETPRGNRFISMARKHISQPDEFDEYGCPRTEHPAVDCPGDACRFAGDYDPEARTVVEGYFPGPNTPAAMTGDTLGIVGDLADRLRIELGYRLLTVGAHYRTAGQRGTKPDAEFVNGEIEDAVIRMTEIFEENNPGRPDLRIVDFPLPTPAEDTPRTPPGLNDRVRVADAVNGDWFGVIVKFRGGTSESVGVRSATSGEVEFVSGTRVVHGDEVGHDAVVGWDGEGDFRGRCSCGKWSFSGLPDQTRTAATTHAGSFRDVSRIDS